MTQLAKKQIHSLSELQVSAVKEIQKLIVDNHPDIRECNSYHAVTSGSLPRLYEMPKEDLTMAIFFEKIKLYVENYYSGVINPSFVAEEFLYLVENKFNKDWSIIDCVAFINFIKSNKPNTIGHKINPLELLESAFLYEQSKSIEREKIYITIKNKEFEKPDEKETLEGTENLTNVRLMLEEKRNKREQQKRDFESKERVYYTKLRNYTYELQEQLFNKLITEKEFNKLLEIFKKEKKPNENTI